MELIFARFNHRPFARIYSWDQDPEFLPRGPAEVWWGNAISYPSYPEFVVIYPPVERTHRNQHSWIGINQLCHIWREPPFGASTDVEYLGKISGPSTLRDDGDPKLSKLTKQYSAIQELQRRKSLVQRLKFDLEIEDLLTGKRLQSGPIDFPAGEVSSCDEFDLTRAIGAKLPWNLPEVAEQICWLEEFATSRGV